ncbi:MAG TPA: hypothetical protein VKD04_09020 [Burkholderiales bacterium]|nr:hypothetical protein [Burkholderiales bacterium]
MKKNTLWTALAAAAAFAFLVAMVISGALPEQRQLVKFEAKGVMKLEPDRISRVELHQSERKAVLLRTPDGGWATQGGNAMSVEMAKKLSLAVQFMNTAGPIRVMQPEELAGTNPRDFGLDQPRLTITLFANAQPVLGARFGAHNPEDMAQYMMLDGRQDVILMSRFVGQEWESVAGGVFAK